MHQLLYAQNLMLLLQTLHLQVTYAKKSESLKSRENSLKTLFLKFKVVPSWYPGKGRQQCLL